MAVNPVTASAGEIARAVNAGELSALQVAEAALVNINRQNAALNA